MGEYTKTVVAQRGNRGKNRDNSICRSMPGN